MAREVSGTALAALGAGVIVLYSGIKGKSITTALQSVIQGKSPATAPQANAISGTSSADLAALGVTSAGTAIPGGGGGGTNPGSLQSGPASANYVTIANYLRANGYSRAAAAGIVGCIAGESGGSPEAVGDQGTSFGFIQEHGSQYSGLVTGNPSRDLQAQLPAIVAYNNAQGSGLIAMLNGISDPVQAADFYSAHFERPQVAGSDVRAGVAQQVYAQIH